VTTHLTGPSVPVASAEVGRGRWAHVTSRSSGTTVYRVEGRHCFYVKSTPPWEHPDDPRFNPAAEAERLRWLAGQGLPVPEVVEVGGDGESVWLVTTAMPGRPAAARWSPEDLPRVVDVVADVARAVHALPVARCPFDRRLPALLAEAAVAVRFDAVDLDDVDAAHHGWTARQLLDELRRTPAPPEDDLVVCHGDLCLDNVLVAPDTLSLAGLIDVGRLGVADRWLDLSIALNHIGEDTDWGYGPRHADRFLRRYGIQEIDHAKVAYYRLVDEFM
jgi:aminoglycoside phosphotransferase